VTYVEISAGRAHSVARRSDGTVVAWGDATFSQTNVPTLAAGTTFTQVSGGVMSDFTIALFTSGGFNWLGDGCAGSGGVTRLEPLSLPRLGETFRAFLNPPTSGFAIVFTGFSSVTTPYGPLPFDLSFLGMPGCRLRVSPDLILPVAGSPPRAELPLPAEASLAGALVHQQAFLLDHRANAAGAVVSDAATLVLGN